MLKLLSIFCFFCLYKDVVLYDTPAKPEKVLYQLEDVNEHFRDFMDKYNKNYNSIEYERRYKIFMDNLIEINRWNREQPDVVFGIGPFTDLTFEEFTQKYTGFNGSFTDENAIKYEPTLSSPDSLDWRDSNIVTPVKDQGSCGSCYIFSAIANIESQHAKNGGQLTSLSEQQSLDCKSSGCGGGVIHEVMQSLVDTGCERESNYPYTGQQGQCQYDKSKVAVKVKSGGQISVGSEDELKDAVANYGPLSIAIKTDPQMQKFHGGILKPQDCTHSGHAVLLVGYGSENGVPFWIIKNSWGAQWNEGGYLRMIRGQGACQIGQYVASATVE